MPTLPGPRLILDNDKLKLFDQDLPDLSQLEYMRSIPSFGSGGIHVLRDPKTDKQFALKSGSALFKEEILTGCLATILGLNVPKTAVFNTIPSSLQEACHINADHVFYRLQPLLVATEKEKDKLVINQAVADNVVAFSLLGNTDIKDDNYILASDGKVWWFDFGSNIRLSGSCQVRDVMPVLALLDTFVTSSRYQQYQLKHTLDENFLAKQTRNILEKNIIFFEYLRQLTQLLEIPEPSVLSEYYHNRFAFLHSRYCSENPMFNFPAFPSDQDSAASGVLPYRVRDDQLEILLVQLCLKQNTWGTPGGSSESKLQGERPVDRDLMDTAIAETSEETGGAIQLRRDQLLNSHYHDLVTIVRPDRATCHVFRLYFVNADVDPKALMSAIRCKENPSPREISDAKWLPFDVLKSVSDNSVTFENNAYQLFLPFATLLSKIGDYTKLKDSLMRHQRLPNNLRSSLIAPHFLQELVARQVLKKSNMLAEIKSRSTQNPAQVDDALPAVSIMHLGEMAKNRINVDVRQLIQKHINYVPEDLVPLFAEILSEERRLASNGQVVLYHGADKSILFLTQFISRIFHRLLGISEEKIFLRFFWDEKFRNILQKSNAHVYKDGNQEAMLCTNLSLFSGGFGMNSAEFFLKMGSVSPPDVGQIINNIIPTLGIPVYFSDKALTLYKQYSQLLSNVLFQFSLTKEIADEYVRFYGNTYHSHRVVTQGVLRLSIGDEQFETVTSFLKCIKNQNRINKPISNLPAHTLIFLMPELFLNSGFNARVWTSCEIPSEFDSALSHLVDEVCLSALTPKFKIPLHLLGMPTLREQCCDVIDTLGMAKVKDCDHINPYQLKSIISSNQLIPLKFLFNSELVDILNLNRLESHYFSSQINLLQMFKNHQYTAESFSDLVLRAAKAMHEVTESADQRKTFCSKIIHILESESAWVEHQSSSSGIDKIELYKNLFSIIFEEQFVFDLLSSLSYDVTTDLIENILCDEALDNKQWHFLKLFSKLLNKPIIAMVYRGAEKAKDIIDVDRKTPWAWLSKKSWLTKFLKTLNIEEQKHHSWHNLDSNNKCLFDYFSLEFSRNDRALVYIFLVIFTDKLIASKLFVNGFWRYAFDQGDIFCLRVLEMLPLDLVYRAEDAKGRTVCEYLNKETTAVVSCLRAVDWLSTNSVKENQKSRDGEKFSGVFDFLTDKRCFENLYPISPNIFATKLNYTNSGRGDQYCYLLDLKQEIPVWQKLDLTSLVNIRENNDNDFCQFVFCCDHEICFFMLDNQNNYQLCFVDPGNLTALKRKVDMTYVLGKHDGVDKCLMFHNRIVPYQFIMKNDNNHFVVKAVKEFIVCNLDVQTDVRRINSRDLFSLISSMQDIGNRIYVNCDISFHKLVIISPSQSRALIFDMITWQTVIIDPKTDCLKTQGCFDAYFNGANSVLLIHRQKDSSLKRCARIYEILTDTYSDVFTVPVYEDVLLFRQDNVLILRQDNGAVVFFDCNAKTIFSVPMKAKSYISNQEFKGSQANHAFAIPFFKLNADHPKIEFVDPGTISVARNRCLQEARPAGFFGRRQAPVVAAAVTTAAEKQQAGCGLSLNK